MDYLRLHLGNIHCDDCHRNIHKVLTQDFRLSLQLSQFPNTASYVVEGDEIVITGLAGDHRYNISIDLFIKNVVKRLKSAGFEILSVDWSNSDDQEDLEEGLGASKSVEVPESKMESLLGFKKLKENRAHKKHIEHCSKCKEEEKGKGLSSDESFETVVEKQTREFRAMFAIGGMTCASCSKSVDEAIERALSENSMELKDGDDKPNYSVDLLKNTAVVIVPNKHMINKIMTAITDAGFACNLLEVLPVERTINTKVTAVIAGMTCAACANSISSAVKELTFILDCNINVVTKTAVFVMEGSESNIAKLKETVEDCGFDFELLSKDTINYNSVKKQSRSINLRIDGMFCNHCPEVVHDYLATFGEAVVIDSDSTLEDPFIQFTYVPNQARNITLRRIMKDLNHIFASPDEPAGYKIDYSKDGPFKCQIVQPVTVDEKIRRLRKKELRALIRRLIIATVFAIPTFIFGVVAMSLLPKGNLFRTWVDEPLWTGNVSRNTWILFFLSTPVYFFAADVFHRKAFLEVKSLWLHKNSFKKRLFKFGSMNLLMCLGTSVSYFASIVLLILSSQQDPHSHMAFHTTYFDSVVFLSFFLLIGRLLEAISKSKTADAVSGLCDIKVHEATLISTSSEEGVEVSDDVTVAVNLLEVDDLIRISPGESPPVDCVIIENSSEFDESALTGESTPVKHVPGHQIFSGTVNVGNNALVAKVLSLESDSLIDQILNTVREGQIRKAPIERLADTLTGYFVPLIVLIAIITFVIWLSLSLSGALPDSYLDVDIGGWGMWSLEFAIAVFVIACPCGIGLAAPTALFVGASLAAKNGVLVKGGGAAFQDAAKTKVVCFDKTGTLTYGKLKVTDYAFIGDDQDNKLFSIQLARDLELSSKHPLAEAVKKFAEYYAKKNDWKLSSNKTPLVENVPGKGLRGEVVLEENDGSIWKNAGPSSAILGNEALIKDFDVHVTREQTQALNKWKSEKKSVILVALKNPAKYKDERFHLALFIACRDQIRAETKAVIHHLQVKLGIECWMITGDNKITAHEIGKDIGIPEDHIVAEVLPDDKQEKVKSIKGNKPNQVVAMVGDGINDAPALASADIGIALSSGADLAVTSSDFILLNTTHPLACLLTVFDLAKVVFRRVKFNFGWALVYNIIGIPIAAGVIYPYNNSRLSPVWASAAMAASSVSVVLSSLALRFYRPKVKSDSMTQQEDEEVKEAQL